MACLVVLLLIYVIYASYWLQSIVHGTLRVYILSSIGFNKCAGKSSHSPFMIPVTVGSYHHLSAREWSCINISHRHHLAETKTNVKDWSKPRSGSPQGSNGPEVYDFDCLSQNFTLLTMALVPGYCCLGVRSWDVDNKCLFDNNKRWSLTSDPSCKC